MPYSNDSFSWFWGIIVVVIGLTGLMCAVAGPVIVRRKGYDSKSNEFWISIALALFCYGIGSLIYALTRNNLGRDTRGDAPWRN